MYNLIAGEFVIISSTQASDVSPLKTLPRLRYAFLGSNKIESLANMKDAQPKTEYIFALNPLGTEIPKSEENCPTMDVANPYLLKFCSE